jgi:hypothetical protein
VPDHKPLISLVSPAETKLKAKVFFLVEKVSIKRSTNDQKLETHDETPVSQIEPDFYPCITDSTDDQKISF